MSLCLIGRCSTSSSKSGKDESAFVSSIDARLVPGAMKRFVKPNIFRANTAVAVLHVEGSFEPSRRVGQAPT